MRSLALVLALAAGCGAKSAGTRLDGSVRDTAAAETSAPLDTAPVCPGMPDYTSADQCNTVPNTAVAVSFTDGTGDPPAFTGGTILDGVYQATKVEGWNPVSRTGRRFTIVVAEQGKKLFWSGDVLTETESVSLKAITTAATSGNQLTQAALCLQGAVGIPNTMSYTATPSRLVLAATQGDALLVTTYTRMGCP